MRLPLQPLRSKSKPNQAKIFKTGQPRLVWSLGGLAVLLFAVIFGTVLAIHLLTLPARRVPTALVGSNAASQFQLTSNVAVSSISAPTSGLLIPVGQIGQNIVQGEFGLRVDQVLVLEPEASNPAEPKSLLVAVHAHLTTFQGSYYKVRSLTGSTFRLLTATPNAGLIKASPVTASPFAKQPALNINQEQSMQFGDVVSGWLTFEMTGVNKTDLKNTLLEFQFIPANSSIPVRVQVAGLS